MKVRFTSPKERHPDHDGGLKVLYAPGKRAAFKLRWYLIVLIICSPFLWFLGKLAVGLVWVEAPGQTHLATLAVRAPDTATVARIMVSEGELITSGQPMLELKNTLWETQKRQLTRQLDNLRDRSPVQRERQHLEQTLERVRSDYQQVQTLFNQSAVTQRELTQAREALERHERELLTFDRTVAADNAAQSRQYSQLQRELALVQTQLDQLAIEAPAATRVRELHVDQGENVGAGTPLITLERQKAPELWVFVPAKHRDLAQPGQKVEVHFPDGYQSTASVQSTPVSLERLPPTMRSGLTSDVPALFLKVEPEQSLPDRWHLSQVPLTIRFPSAIERWLGQ